MMARTTTKKIMATGKMIWISRRSINAPNVMGIRIPTILSGMNCRLYAVPLDLRGMILATNDEVIGIVIMLKNP